MAAAVRREGRSGEGGQTKSAPWLGLTLLEQGCITSEQLREAREDQRRGAAETGEEKRIEEWLRQSGILSEAALTRALSAQWNCPVFSLAESRPEEMEAALPSFLAEAFGALPVRVAANRLLYVAFSGRIDRSLSYAIGHMTGLRVATGMARESEFRTKQTRFFAGGAPRTRFLEAGSLEGLAEAMAQLLEREKTVDARLARIHEFWWLRIWRKEPVRGALPRPGQVEDLIATVVPRPRDTE